MIFALNRPISKNRAVTVTKRFRRQAHYCPLTLCSYMTRRSVFAKWI